MPNEYDLTLLSQVYFKAYVQADWQFWGTRANNVSGAPEVKEEYKASDIGFERSFDELDDREQWAIMIAVQAVIRKIDPQAVFKKL